MLAFLLSLFFLEASFAGGYLLPLTIGAATGLLSARLAFVLARGRPGWRSWGWRAFGVLALLEVAAQLPRYAYTVAEILE